MKNNEINQKRKCQLFGTTGKPLRFIALLLSPSFFGNAGFRLLRRTAEWRRGEWSDRPFRVAAARRQERTSSPCQQPSGLCRASRSRTWTEDDYRSTSRSFATSISVFVGSRFILREIRRKAIQIPIAIKTNFKPTKDNDASPRKYTSAPQNIFQTITDTREYNKNFLKEKWSIPAAVEVRAARFGCQ